MVDTAEVEGTIDRARGGDRDALATLWRTHQHLLLRYFRGRGVSSPDDLASQVWIDVATGLHRFDGDDVDFRRWLFTIARRRHIDEFRRTSRRREAAEIDPGSPEIDKTVDAAAEADFDAAESLARALELVRCLPDDMADAVLLRVVGDLSVSEVALIMGRREGHVRVLAHRGLERLRTMSETMSETRSGTMSATTAAPSVDPNIRMTS
jgi:RNA polymerase sigma-70 factor (ECF subfamily)